VRTLNVKLVKECVKGYQGHRDGIADENPPRLDYKLNHWINNNSPVIFK